MSLSLLGSSITATADEYDDQRNNNSKIGQQQENVQAAGAALQSAVAAADQARNALAAAQSALQTAQDQRSAAQALDQKRAQELLDAQSALEEANAAVAQGNEDLKKRREDVSRLAAASYRDQNPLIDLSILLRVDSSASFADRMQWKDQLMRSRQEILDRLVATQYRLEQSQAARTKAQQSADEARKQSAEALHQRQVAEEAAVQQAASVQALTAAAEQAQANAQNALGQEKEQLANLESERNRIQQSIQERVAREEADRRAAEARRQQQNNPRPAPPPPETVSGLTSPIPGAPLTSGYGMRWHPVLGIYVLHDGVDFGAGCGTPIRAAASGTVATVFFTPNGYGLQAQIDHGLIGGVSMTTSYSHATNYIISPGQYVTQGQVIGYVGSTGYSTGCHLHFMLYVNGGLVDPLPYLP